MLPSRVWPASSCPTYLLLLDTTSYSYLVFQTLYGWESTAGRYATCRPTLRAG